MRHKQDLGDAGSCVKKFSSLPFLFCNKITGSCKYSTRNDHSVWLSGENRQPLDAVSNQAIEPFISRCVVCEAPSPHIAVHSQDLTQPYCPTGWTNLWVGYSFMQMAGISSSGSCLERFRSKPFIECQGGRGTCKFYADKFSFWLRVVQPSKQFDKPKGKTYDIKLGDDLTQYVSRCVVCVRDQNKLQKDLLYNRQRYQGYFNLGNYYQ
jgi:integrin beta 8